MPKTPSPDQSGFIARWAWRLDFLRRECAARARTLADIIAALAPLRFSADDDGRRPLLLIDGEVEARYLRRAMAARLIPKAEVRVITDADTVAVLAPAEFDGRRVFVVGSLFARYHMVWIDRIGRDRYTVI